MGHLFLMQTLPFPAPKPRDGPVPLEGVGDLLMVQSN